LEYLLHIVKKEGATTNLVERKMNLGKDSYVIKRA